MKTYAYVTNEGCIPDAKRRGAYIGRDEILVSKHGDYSPWYMGKRETLEMIHDQRTSDYKYRCALHVARLLGWMPPR